MKKIITVFIVMATIMLCGALSASAKTMDMYINGMYSTQEVEQIGGFDMLPAEEVSGYFGFTSYFDGYTLTFYGTERTYYFHIGDAVVTDNAGGWYGLDITPRLINNTVYIPAKFFCDTFGMTYTWDWVTETIFINSDYTYNWLISTDEYWVGRKRKTTENALAKLVAEEYDSVINEWGKYYDNFITVCGTATADYETFNDYYVSLEAYDGKSYNLYFPKDGNWTKDIDTVYDEFQSKGKFEIAVIAANANGKYRVISCRY